MKVAIYGIKIDQAHQKDIQILFEELLKIESEVLIHKRFHDELKKNGLDPVVDYTVFESHHELTNQVDFMLSIGGDGTFLDTISLIRSKNIPILGINTGRLGFLSNTSTAEIPMAIKCLKSGKFTFDKRSLLSIESESNLFGEDNHALNEISIMKRDSSSMITIHTSLDGNHLNSYWTDGLIVSTSTGSTAYSMSCGGPILMPGSGNFVLTPIAPHNLNVRPIVIDDQSILTISVEGRAKKNLVALDSRSKELNNEELLTIKKADYQISLVQLENQSFLNSLRNKLNWGLDRRNY